MSVEELYQEIASNEETDVTFSGGECMLQAKAFTELAKLIKQNTDKTIWIYSGFTYEEIIKDPTKKELLSYCSVLVDGKYIEELRDISLAFRGSSNQKCIDVQQSLQKGEVVLYE